MPMTMKVTGIEELGQKLRDLGDQAVGIAAKALYNGAGVMATAYSKAFENIRTEPFRYVWNGRKRLPSPEEKAALVGASGVARFEKSDAEVNTSVGIRGAGYVNIAGRRKAVKLIANSINSGTSFMDKQPIFRQAVTNTKNSASQAIVDTADRLIEEITK